LKKGESGEGEGGATRKKKKKSQRRRVSGAVERREGRERKERGRVGRWIK
jgi:hypothetical protein